MKDGLKLTPKMRTLLPIATVALLGLVGCSGDAQPVPTVTVTETATAAPEPPQEEPKEEPVAEEIPEQAPAGGQVEYKSHGESSRGSLIKHVGDWAAIMDTTNQNPSVEFRIIEIEVNPKCTSGFSDRPENDQFVRLEFEIVTYPSLKESGSFYLSEHDVAAYTSDGTRINNPQGAGWSCLSEKDSLPMDIGPGEKVAGSIVLDLPKDAGAISISNYLTDGAWEWPLVEGDGA